MLWRDVEPNLELENGMVWFYKKVCSWKLLVKKVKHKHLIQKTFPKNTRVVFLTLDHVLRISTTCFNYVLCSLDPGEYNDYN